jgi:hypothetical protein
MSDIKVGDLVVVVHPSKCIGGMDGLGHTFRATEVRHIRGNWSCYYCLKRHNTNTHVVTDGDGVDWAGYRLKKIPPLADLQTQRQTEEITA